MNNYKKYKKSKYFIRYNELLFMQETLTISYATGKRFIEFVYQLNWN